MLDHEVLASPPRSIPTMICPQILPFLWYVIGVVVADRVVMTNNGPVQGVTVSSEEAMDIEAFLGIPYAELLLAD
ncbi:hypothetical protein CEXT_169451 [Caerostris extrusa]|uniref:Uncharacterized protein n=1 Tax=Caerostris extrusa TaxID=172846 RepID=A0AAV4V2F8_CAEEX|nr:hypothetical protein CEXT_169451 [Caerostris extrusa]